MWLKIKHGESDNFIFYESDCYIYVTGPTNVITIPTA